MLAKLVNFAAAQAKLTPKQLKSASRQRQVADARFAVWLVALEHGYTVTGLARAFNRNHASICHGVRRAKDAESTPGYANLAALVRALRQKFSAAPAFDADEEITI
jgi:chromosomal replication initiation ATPase DnaA